MSADYQYAVLLVIHSPTMPLSELAAQLGMQPSHCSHSKGDPHLSKKKPAWDSTLFKIESPLPVTATLEQHINVILSSLSDRARSFLNAMPSGCTAYLDAGVIVNTHQVASPSIELPSPIMRALAERGLDLLITMYPAGPGPTVESDSNC
jgi:hypothetical protein